MNRNLLIVLAFLIAGFSQKGSAQCVPNTSITVPGIYPDSATGLAGGVVGTPYSEVIQAKVLTDTSLNGLPVVITNITVSSVTGLPPGLTYSCTPASCIFPGGSNGCMLISGTPTTAGVYPLTVVLAVNGTIFGQPLPPQNSTLSYYSITIDATTGITGNIADLKFDFSSIKPNPAANFTDVAFTSPVAGDFVVKMYNMLGKEVMNQNIRGMAGVNTSRLNLERLSSGVYVVSVDNGVSVITQRMVVSRK